MNIVLIERFSFCRVFFLEGEPHERKTFSYIPLRREAGSVGHGVLRYGGNRKGKVGFFLGANGIVKDKAMQERLLAAASKLGWETKVVKSTSSSKEEAEFVMDCEALFMSYLSDYRKASDDIATILKAAK